MSDDPLGKPPQEAERVLRIGIDVQANELITTNANDRAHLVFLDGSSLTVGPNAQLTIDKFVFDPSTKTGELAINEITQRVFNDLQKSLEAGTNALLDALRQSTGSERAPGRPDGLPWPELAARVQARLQRLYPRAFFDARHDALRGLVPLPTDEQSATEALWQACDALAREDGLLAGLSDVDRFYTNAQLAKSRKAGSRSAVRSRFAANSGSSWH